MRKREDEVKEKRRKETLGGNREDVGKEKSRKETLGDEGRR